MKKRRKRCCNCPDLIPLGDETETDEGWWCIPCFDDNHRFDEDGTLWRLNWVQDISIWKSGRIPLKLESEERVGWKR